MRTRLTEEEVKSLNLTAVNWTTVREAEIEKVYIRAYPESPMYGPYRVIDAGKQMISKLDGTEKRYYPRDKGLFADLASQTTKWRVFDEEVKEEASKMGIWRSVDPKGRAVIDPKNPLETVEVIKGLLQVTADEIIELEIKIDELYTKQETLEEILEKLE